MKGTLKSVLIIFAAAMLLWLSGCGGLSSEPGDELSAPFSLFPALFDQNLDSVSGRLSFYADGTVYFYGGTGAGGQPGIYAAENGGERLIAPAECVSAMTGNSSVIYYAHARSYSDESYYSVTAVDAGTGEQLDTHNFSGHNITGLLLTEGGLYVLSGRRDFYGGQNSAFFLAEGNLDAPPLNLSDIDFDWVSYGAYAEAAAQSGAEQETGSAQYFYFGRAAKDSSALVFFTSAAQPEPTAPQPGGISVVHLATGSTVSTENSGGAAVFDYDGKSTVAYRLYGEKGFPLVRLDLSKKTGQLLGTSYQPEEDVPPATDSFTHIVKRGGIITMFNSVNSLGYLVRPANNTVLTYDIDSATYGEGVRIPTGKSAENAEQRVLYANHFDNGIIYVALVPNAPARKFRVYGQNAAVSLMDGGVFDSGGYVYGLEATGDYIFFYGITSGGDGKLGTVYLKHRISISAAVTYGDNNEPDNDTVIN